MISIRRGMPEDLSKPSIISLLREGSQIGDTGKVDRFVADALKKEAICFVAEKNETPIGILICHESAPDHWEITAIDTASSHRKVGIGRQLTVEMIKKTGAGVIEAETDDDAVGFYHALGFCIQNLAEKYPGVIRYRCIHNDLNWVSPPCIDMVGSFKKEVIPFWISGGHAIDLHVGRETRDHIDLDISILRKDQLILKKIFRGWEMYHTHGPGLRRWSGEDFLDKIPNVWIRKDRESPWVVEIMFQDSREDRWIYRRNTKINRNLEDIGYVDSEGIPYLRPEIQLLYKAGGSGPGPREKDLADLRSVLPLMATADIQWLTRAIKLEFPEGHDWLQYL